MRGDVGFTEVDVIAQDHDRSFATRELGEGGSKRRPLIYCPTVIGDDVVLW